MPRISRQKSSVISDITNTHLSPLAASSPRASSRYQRADDLPNSLEEIEEYANALKKEYTDKIERAFELQKAKLYEEKDALLSSGDFSGPATLSFIKSLMVSPTKVRSSASTSFKDNPKKKKTQSATTTSTSLDVIPEEGEAKAVPTEVNENADDSNDGVFKKPAGRGKRTLKQGSFITPKAGRHGYNVAVVTPGPNSTRPVNILRRPNPGEMAISMTGSPLLIAHNNIPSHVPQISIPLSDGRVMTVVATEGLDPDMSICSELDSETCERLEVLGQLIARKTRKNKK